MENLGSFGNELRCSPGVEHFKDIAKNDISYFYRLIAQEAPCPVY
jgi:hypothetical protein